MSRARPAGFAHIASPPMSDATSACPIPTARAPTGTRRKSAASGESPCPCAAAGAMHNAAASAARTSARTPLHSLPGALERRGLIDEHHGNVVAHGVAEFARVAVERGLLFAIHERTFAARADEDFEEAGCEGHGGVL